MLPSTVVLGHIFDICHIWEVSMGKLDPSEANPGPHWQLKYKYKHKYKHKHMQA